MARMPDLSAAVKRLLKHYTAADIAQEANAQEAARALASKQGRGGNRRPKTLRANAYSVWIAVEARKRLHQVNPVTKHERPLGVAKIAKQICQDWHGPPRRSARYRDIPRRGADNCQNRPSIAAELEQFVKHVVKLHELARCTRWPPGQILPLLWLHQGGSEDKIEMKGPTHDQYALADIDGNEIHVLIRAGRTSEITAKL